MRGVPSLIKIGAVDYTVVLEEKLDGEYGECFTHLQRIKMTKNQTAQCAGDTLLHEILHAVWNEAGLFDTKRLDEERIVRATATWLKMVFRDNPHVAAFILHPEEYWPYTPNETETKDVKA